MSSWHALLLALVQGLTEFLPISSSAHLILLPWIAGFEDQGLVYDAAANTGTLLAVLFYFRADLLSFVRASWRRVLHRAPLAEVEHPADEVPEALFWMIGVATLPVALVGFFAQDWIAVQARNPVLIGWTSLLFGLLLGLADWRGRRELPLFGLRFGSTFAIGLAQAVALVPGVSRAGITMTAGLFAGLNREAAARVSFLLYIPVSLLVAGKDLLDLANGSVAPGDLLPLTIVLVGSALVGWTVIELLLAWLQRRSLQVFVVYRVVLGIAILAIAN